MWMMMQSIMYIYICIKYPYRDIWMDDDDNLSSAICLLWRGVWVKKKNKITSQHFYQSATKEHFKTQTQTDTSTSHQFRMHTQMLKCTGLIISNYIRLKKCRNDTNDANKKKLSCLISARMSNYPSLSQAFYLKPKQTQNIERH